MAPVEFGCKGNILGMIFADQLHDFLGERGIGGVGTRKKEDIISYLDSGWKDFKFSVKKESERVQQSNNYQAVSENSISYYSGESGGLKLGTIKTFKKLDTAKDKEKARIEEDLGIGMRLYIQGVSKELGYDIQKTDYMADVHIDALKGKGSNFSTAMINLPVTLRAINDVKISGCDLKMREYFRQIQYTPLLSNIFDMATFSQLYKTSAAYYAEDIKIKNNVNHFRITDTEGNNLEWELVSVPKFYNIAYWFIKDGRKFYDTEEVDEFIRLFGLDPKDKTYFMYSLMVDGYKNFIDKKIELSDKSSKTLKSVLKSALGKTIKIGQSEVYTYLSIKIKKDDLTETKLKNYCKYILNMVDNILNVSTTQKDKLFFYTTGGCKNVYIDKDFMENLIFYSFITKLKVNDKDYTKHLLHTQKRLQNNTSPGASVNNILNSLKGEKDKDKMFVYLMLKSLGDLSISTGSFYDGIVTGKKINFFATFDRTAACIATTLTLKGKSLYKHVLLEQPSYGVAAYNPSTLEGELTISEILSLGDLEIIEKQQLLLLENTDINCEFFKDKYLDTITDENTKKELSKMNCKKTKDENWNILENVEQKDVGYFNWFYTTFSNFFKENDDDLYSIMGRQKRKRT
jgi:hypothetical protein